MGGEPAIVVERRKELTYLLCQAAELEHAVMCEYLYAAFSLKSTAGPGLRDDQLGAVEGWRGVLFAIAKEEMLHWAVVQNLLTSVGSAPYVSRPHMPHQARGTRPGCSFACCPSVSRRCSTSCTWSGRKGWRAPTLKASKSPGCRCWP